MKFGLIGHPIAHSLSPALFKAGYDGRYPYDLIQDDNFEESYSRFIKEYDGINVTAPFKELAYAKADIVSDECKLIKATNLLVKTPEGVKAHNSDLLGVRMWLKEILNHPLIASSDARPGRVFANANTKRQKGSPAERSEDGMPLGAVGKADWGMIHPTTLVVGCGGAGKAAAVAAVTLGMKAVLMNRNPEKAARLAEDLTGEGFDVETRPLDNFRTCFAEADIIIYNIPAPIHGLASLTKEDFAPGKTKFILEANYRNPSFDETLLAEMRKANPLARYTGGRTWLLYQALTGYEIFTGEKPDLEKMSVVL
jgi:shikimate 5-dehydrogenase